MYSFFLDGILLPITPGKVTLKIKGSNQTLTLANEGELNVLRAPGLTEITFDAVLPMLNFYSFSRSYFDPTYYLNRFERLMTEKRPCRFLIVRRVPDGARMFDTNMKVSLESYTITENASNGPDVTVSLTLKQYVAYATKKIQIIQTQETADVREETPRDTDDAPKITSYEVQEGDTLWLIAKKVYGDGAEYFKIYQANRELLEDPDWFCEGQVLTIP